MNNESKSDTNKLEFEYSRDVLLTYKNSPTEWKLNWLEEINNITFQVLDEQHQILRNKMRYNKSGS